MGTHWFTQMAQRAICLLALSIFITPSTAPAAAKHDFPSKAVTIVTTFSVGSGPDAMMRIVGEQLSELWGKPVIVDNRPGGAGFIAVNAMKSAIADGHTLLMHDGDSLSAMPSLFKSRDFRVFEQFEPIGVLYSTPFFVVVAKDAPWKTVGDLLEAAKAAPGGLSYGSWGVGSAGHLHAAQLEDKADVQMLHVPYKEMSQLYTDIGAGEPAWALGARASTRFAFESGRIKYLGVASAKRLSDMPDIPTLAESGASSEVEASGFVALLAPKGTPSHVVNKLNNDLIKVVKNPTVQERYDAFSFEAAAWSPEQTRKTIEHRTATYEQIIERRGIKLD